ncbi:hypothetical protein A2U01_0090628, partial [Trifolium medium]|nr:hypothetical protein [Trifolium medium]
ARQSLAQGAPVSGARRARGYIFPCFICAAATGERK